MASMRRPCQSLQHALIVLSLCIVSALGVSETDALIKLKASLLNSDVPLRNWNASRVPCIGKAPQFTGVICTDDARVWGLQLEGMGLSGTIDIDSLVGLQNLKTLSFSNNSFQGPIPGINKLPALKSLYLSNNHFSGDIPDDTFDGMVWMKKLYLSQNEFTGAIPSSLTKPGALLELRLDGNQFRGNIPEFPQKGLKFVNVSNNQLYGAVPDTLSKEDPSLLSGNAGLCGGPLAPCHTNEFKGFVGYGWF